MQINIKITGLYILDGDGIYHTYEARTNDTDIIIFTKKEIETFMQNTTFKTAQDIIDALNNHKEGLDTKIITEITQRKQKREAPHITPFYEYLTGGKTKSNNDD
ncbi:TPA: hypothetical protein EYG96_03185 [Candidatus Gracilibacteria bacterium]|nr:hypothetical protein [Candidatus Gracilibacteria bacterium]